MKSSHEAQDKQRADLKALFAAELFSKLTSDKQDIIIEQIKDLLSTEE